MKAKIYQPSKSAMQSGEKKLPSWILEFEPECAKYVEPLMGWTGSADTQQQLRLKFTSKDKAIAYAKAKNIAYTVLPQHLRAKVKKSYADNFAYKPTTQK